MRTYTVESETCGEILNERLKKVTNVQILSIGAMTSLLMLGILLLRTLVLQQHQSSQQQQQHQQQFTWTLWCLESRVLPLPQTALLAQRTVEIIGNTDAANLYWTRTCPDVEDYEKEEFTQHVQDFHQGKLQKEILLVNNSIVTLKLEHANGPIEVTAFSTMNDELDYERRPKENKNKIIKTDTADAHRTVEMEIIASKTDTYVFLFQGRRGQSAEATYSITRRRYNVQSLIPLSPTINNKNDNNNNKNKESCSYRKCQIIRNTAGCFILQSTSSDTRREASFQINVIVNYHYGWIVLLSLLPMVAALVYAKFNAKPIVQYQHHHQHQHLTGNNSTMMMPGYELVASDADEVWS